MKKHQGIGPFKSEKKRRDRRLDDKSVGARFLEMRYNEYENSIMEEDKDDSDPSADVSDHPTSQEDQEAISTAGKVIKCRGVEVAPPQADEVRLKILFASLCHTDVCFWKAKEQTPLFPRIFGHEAGGIVESIGKGVTEIQAGDHVLAVPYGECKNCRHCKSEESNSCDLLRFNTDRGVMLNDGQTRFSKNGKPIYNFVGTSTLSEYTVVHAGCVAKCNTEAPLDTVCILGCSICTGLGAVINVAKPPQGSSVAIFGLGTVGLAAAEGARIAGAARIIGIDLNPSRFEEAKKFGLIEFLNPNDYDRPVHEGWGVAVLAAVPNKDDYKPRTHRPALVDLYMNKKLELDKYISQSVPLMEINKALDHVVQGNSLKCIIRFAE
ncbi:hypothetical protein FEM48_Zijuj06G0198100 [Ziziphus jujuba var. spinosa]|uniref:Alcohol dehydrogenase 1 n=1 Tax=Ziziphus jujuba var. spinosa TaxID=714518 RepID=A0A978VB99_ZIZJJ|nr:hypothetical protein FEM48_Zijuj06G0198100 [Ziziphus jujuba var. spinosa]